MIMCVIGWIVMGVAVGVAANLWARKRGTHLPPDLLLGIGAAVAGGWIFTVFADFDLRSVGVAALAALLILFISHAPDAGSALRRM